MKYKVIGTKKAHIIAPLVYAINASIQLCAWFH